MFIASRGQVIPGPAGKIRWVGTNTDVTARKNYDARLKRAAREWRRTFDAISDLIFLVDPGHRIVRVNRAVALLFNLGFQEILGRPYSRLIYGQDSPP